MFAVPPDDALHPVRMYERLRVECQEFAEWSEFEPVVDFLYRDGEFRKKERRILATCYMPTVQGELRSLFDWMLERTLGRIPDYLIVIESDFWSTSALRAREALLFHEMHHIGPSHNEFGEMRLTREGTPIWRVVPHDLEEFNAVVKRYGAWSGDIGAFLAAARQGGSV